MDQGTEARILFFRLLLGVSLWFIYGKLLICVRKWVDFLAKKLIG